MKQEDFEKLVAERDEERATSLFYVLIEDMHFKDEAVREETWKLWFARKSIFENEIARVNSIAEVKPRPDEKKADWWERVKDHPIWKDTQSRCDDAAHALNAYIFDHAWAIYFQLDATEGSEAP